MSLAPKGRRVAISFYASNNSGNRGVSASLNNLQKVSADNQLVIKTTAESDFGTSDVEDFSD